MLVYWIVDTQSGQKDVQVFPISGRWERKLIGYGGGSHTFRVQGAAHNEDQRAAWRDLLKTDWSRTLVVAWVDDNDPTVERPLYAGVITRADPQADGTVDVDHSEVRMFLDVRLPFTVFDTPAFVVANRSWRGIIAQALVYAINGDSRRALPFEFLFFDEAGSQTIEVPNWELKTIEEIVADAQKADGGPDLEFRQKWSFSNQLQWQIRMGNPVLSGPQMEFNVTAPQPGTMAYGVIQDGGKLTSTVWGAGKGSGSEMKVGKAQVGGSSPAKERVRSFKDEENVDVLNGMSLAEAEAFETETRQPSVTVPLASALEQGFELGSPVRLLFAEHWWEFDGAQNMRLMGYSNDGGDQLELIVQEA